MSEIPYSAWKVIEGLQRDNERLRTAVKECLPYVAHVDDVWFRVSGLIAESSPRTDSEAKREVPGQ